MSNRLVATEVWWDIYTDKEVPARISDYFDSYFSNDRGIRSFGRFDSQNISASFQSTRPVRRVVATIAYAEYDDGRQLGPDQIGFSSLLADWRTQIQKYHQQILTAFQKNGGSREALLMAIQTAKLESGLFDPQLERSRLFGLYAQKGVDAVLDGLSTPRVSPR